MKANRLFWAVALILGVTFSSCTKEQSELKLSDVAGSATIYGQVKYNQGVKKDGSIIYNDYLEVLPSVEVYVDLVLDDYKTGSAGVERYSAKTDANGNYSISIPVGQKPINNEVHVAPFVGTYGEFVNGAYCTYDDAIYQDMSAEVFNVSNGDRKLVNINVSGTPKFAVETIDRPVQVLGTVEEVIEKRIFNDGSYDVKNIVAGTAMLEDGDVIVTLSNKNGDDRTIEYSLRVSEGEFENEIYFYSTWSYDDVKATLSMEDVVVTEDDDSDDQFAHFYVESGETTAKTQYIAGTYSLQSERTVYLQSSTTKESVCEFPTITLGFEPETTDGIRGIESGSSEYKYYNPMYW